MSSIFLSESGSLFQIDGPHTLKLLDAKVLLETLGTTNNL